MSGHYDNKARHIKIEVDVVAKVFLLEVDKPESEAKDDDEARHHTQVDQVLFIRNLIQLQFILCLIRLLLLASLALIIAVLKFVLLNFLRLKHDLIRLKFFDAIKFSDHCE